MTTIVLYRNELFSDRAHATNVIESPMFEYPKQAKSTSGRTVVACGHNSTSVERMTEIADLTEQYLLGKIKPSDYWEDVRSDDPARILFVLSKAENNKLKSYHVDLDNIMASSRNTLEECIPEIPVIYGSGKSATNGFISFMQWSKQPFSWSCLYDILKANDVCTNLGYDVTTGDDLWKC